MSLTSLTWSKPYILPIPQATKFLNWNRICALIIISTIVSGIFLRFFGYKDHVTYIDELMVITEGRWNSFGNEYSSRSDSAVDFTKNLMNSGGVSYAPLQFIATYFFIKNSRPLSKKSLEQARLVSVIIGCFSVIFICLLFYEINNCKLSSSFLIPLTLFSICQINIINSQQAHPYMLGVFSYIFLIYSLLIIVKSKNLYLCIALSFVLCLLPFSNYLLIPVILISLTLSWLSLVSTSGQTASFYRLSCFKILFLIPLMFISIILAMWVYENKSSMSIPWWVHSFKIKDNYPSYTDLFLDLSKNIFYTLESTLTIAFNKTTNNIALFIYFAVFFIGLLNIIYISLKKLVKYNSNHHEHKILNVFYLPLFIILASLIYLIGLFILNKIAISPSRHLLMLSTIFMIIIFYCSISFKNLIDRFFPKNSAANLLNIIFSVSILIPSLLDNISNANRKKEAFQPEKLIEISKKTNSNIVATDYYSYDKYFIYLEPYIILNKIKLIIIDTEEKNLPKEKFLLVGQFTDHYRYLYYARNYQNYKSELIFKDHKNYDFEPSEKITYWPNNMEVYAVEPIKTNKRL